MWLGENLEAERGRKKRQEELDRKRAREGWAAGKGQREARQ
jgi:hypothetical protein